MNRKHLNTLTLLLCLLPVSALASYELEYTDEARSSFMTGCAAGVKELQDKCECMLGYFIQTMPYSEFLEMTQTPGAVDAQLEAAGKQCIPEEMKAR